MKSGVIMVAIVLILGLHIYVSVLGLGFVHWGIFYIYISHDLDWFILYPRCMVNRDTNLSVVCELCNFNFCFHCARLGPVWRSQPVGRIPTELQSAPYHLVSELGDSASPPVPLPTSPHRWICDAKICSTMTATTRRAQALEEPESVRVQPSWMVCLWQRRGGVVLGAEEVPWQGKQI